MHKQKLSFVVPAMNEEESIIRLYTSIAGVVNKIPVWSVNQALSHD
jgi:hypothetical protein